MLVLAFDETAIVPSAERAAGSRRSRSQNSRDSWLFKVTIPRLVRIFNTL